MSFSAGSYVFIPDKHDVVVPAKVETSFSKGKPGKVKLLKGKKSVKLSASDTKGVVSMNEQSLKGLDDMVGFKELNEYSILYNLRMRFESNTIYTNIGRILTSVNPFRMLPLYTPELMAKYVKKGSRNMPPHVYGVADDAFNAMINNAASQSCIVSGESGAGKTEATKVFLQYISEKSRKKDSKKGGKGEMQQKILQSNPLMEAFGNAKTIRNDNSSRFGKWIEVQFNRGGGNIVGGSIKSYLLEKSRIVNQAENERNYHIFYQVCAACGVDPEMKKKYNITDATQYHYLNQSENPCVTVDSIDDKHDWSETKSAMKKVGISKEEKAEILNVLNVVLTVGNVRFNGKDQAAVENKDQVKKTADLIGCGADELEKALTKQDRGTPADPDLVSNYDASQACDARDAFAKQLYSLLFDWLIHKIDKSLGKVSEGKGVSTIGVLDIFGFEFFKHNSFEQLCINFCNERLQGHFNDHIFKLEQDQYKKEGIDVTKIDFEDNSHVIAAIESKDGILHTIANELKLRQATDDTLLTKLKAYADKHKGSKGCVGYPDVKEAKGKPHYQRAFSVKHYAGKVTYTIDQFLEKNRDTMPKLFAKLGKGCKNKFIASLLKNEDGGNKKALGLRFSAQLADLMKDLNATEPHYIRCVKPNAEKVKKKFTSHMVLDQLRCAGLLEVCRIRQMGYPVQKSHKGFYKRYKQMVKAKAKDHKELVKALISEKVLKDKHIQVGNTKIFMKTAAADKLEDIRAKSLGKFAIKIQKVVRGFIVRRKAKKWKKTRKEMKAAIKSRDKKALKKANLNFGALPYQGKHLPEYKKAKSLLNKLEDEEKILKLIKNAMDAKDISLLKAALKAAKEKKLEKMKEAEAAKAMLETLKKNEATKDALAAAIKKDDLKKLEEAIGLAKKNGIKDQLVTDAEALVARLKKEKEVKKKLEDALNKKDKKKVVEYMNEMANIGQADDPLVKKAEKFTHEEAKADEGIEKRKEQVLYNLKKAVKEKNLKALNDLGLEIIELGIDNELTKKAKKLQEELMGDMDICARINAETTAINAKAQTKAGITKEDIAGLEKLVKEAEKTLAQDDFQLLAAKEDVVKLEELLKVQSSLEKTLKKYYEKKKEILKEKDKKKRKKMEEELLAMLKKANDKATAAGANTETAAQVREKLNNLKLGLDGKNAEKRKKERKANLAKLKDANEEDREKLEAKRLGLFTQNLSKKHVALLQEASDNNKYSIDKYYRLRSDEDYVEKISEDLKSVVAQGKLFSQTKPIQKSLCRLDGRENEIAKRINKAILQYCGELSNNYPATLAQFILMKGLEDAGMTDEIYIQLMKHISGNPKHESADRAWLLMCMATKTFPPNSEFSPFLMNFLIGKRKLPGLVGNYARLCIVQLDATIEMGPTFFKPSVDEIQNYRKRPPILATFYTLKGKKFDYPITPEMRVAQILDVLKRREHISENNDQPVWGIYVSAEDEKQVSNTRERLIRYYQAYNPGKLAHVDLFLEHWKGNVETLFEKLKKKYGPEPTPDENERKKGMLALPITAAMNAVKFLGFSAQREQPPPPKCPWALPWWTHLGDVYYRMSRQKKKPRFLFKRRMITKTEKIDNWLYLQAVHDVRTGFLPIKDDNMISHLAALSLLHAKGDEVRKNVSVPALKDAGLKKFIPNSSLKRVPLDKHAAIIAKLLKSNKLPSKKEKIMESYVISVRALPTYGMNFFYARHSASDKNYVISVDVDGIHVLEEDRSAVKRSFVFDTIKKFGATAEYFWMNVDEKQESEKKSKFKFLNNNNGINVLLYTLQSWEMYDCVYDATHIGLED